MRSVIFSILKRCFAPHLGHLIQQFPYAVLPYSINLDISWACNLKCTMCSARLRVNRYNKQYLGPEQFVRILKQLPHLKHIFFMGLGEPLMNATFPILLKQAQSRGISASLITNGMLLTDQLINRFPDNLKRISFSIDSASSEKFGRIRIGANLEKVVENIRRVKILKPKIDIRILVVLMRETIEGLADIVRLGKDVGASAVDVNHVIALDELADKQRITLRISRAEHYLRQAGEEALKCGIEFLSRPLRPRMRSCLQPWLAPLIMLNGDLLPCCFMDRSPYPVCTEWYSGVHMDVPFHQYRIGNVFVKEIKELWNGSEFRLLRKIIRDSETKTGLTIDNFNRKRRNVNMGMKYSYCRVCLFRWSSAC